MTYTLLLVAHIAVLGYWLGSELVINSTYRFICWRSDITFAARDAMMDHLMHADQHVRYALILQLVLGGMLCVSLGLLPGGEPMLFALAGIGIAWLGLVEIAHRKRKERVGQRLATVDRWSRYLLMIGLVAVALVSGDALPFWLRAKLVLFAGIVLCGVGIRLALIQHFRVWREMAEQGPTDAREAVIRGTYVKATSILALLWVFIAVITVLAVLKP